MSFCRKIIVSLSLASLALLACEQVDPLAANPTDAGSDATSEAEAAAPSCCEISEKPACCMHFGGSGTGQACAETCDNIPGPLNPAWEKKIDEKGCPVWYTPPGTALSCNGNPDDSGPDSPDSDAGVCGAAMLPGYKTPGCGTNAWKTCISTGDASALTYCGCDGKTFVSYSDGSEQPFLNVGDCINDPDAGKCGPNQHLGYETAGCGTDAKLVCYFDIWDADLTYYCGCDGTTISGEGYGSPKPFSQKGQCEAGEQ